MVVGSSPANATKSIFRVCIPIGRGDGLRSHTVLVQIQPYPPVLFAALAQLIVQGFRKAQVVGLTPTGGSTLTFFASSSKATQRPIVRSKRHLKSFGAGCRESPERHREDHFRGTRAWTATRGLVAFRKEEATSNQGMISPSQRGVVEQPRVICVRYAGRNPALRKPLHGRVVKRPNTAVCKTAIQRFKSVPVLQFHLRSYSKTSTSTINKPTPARISRQDRSSFSQCSSPTEDRTGNGE